MCNIRHLIVLWNLAHIKIYPLVRDQAKWSQWPVKMATGHFPNCSHNFAWRGVINHDRMITLRKPSMIPHCHLGIKNLLIHWRYPSGSGIYSHMVRRFLAALPSAAKRSTVALVLFTVTSSQGHVNHVSTNMMIPHSPNSEIFIAPKQYIFHNDGARR